ncbi:MAG: putative N-acetyltransferase YycN [Candidatus Celerinatantimonas neptuna]|nr:MAG: putative N-acetyltransferase YycN [Candidatus Celerinatantimonas neptuna]
MLEPMTESSFSKYLEQSVVIYAKENVASGRWPEQGALARSVKEFSQLLPQGLNSPNQHLFHICNPQTGEHVGILWLSIEPDSLSAFIFDIEIDAPFRRQGFATQALKQAEAFAKSQGMAKIGLHVFHNNTSAQTLYTALGYRVVSSNMAKALF